MAASEKTIQQIVVILLRHLSQEQIQQVTADLVREVQGNASVHQTLRALYQATH